MREATEDDDREKALKDVVVATAKEKGKVAAAVKKKADEAERGRVLAEEKLTEMDIMLGGTELKLEEAESLNLAYVDEIADLKVTLEASKEKYYNMGFADAKWSVELIVYQARKHRFEGGVDGCPSGYGGARRLSLKESGADTIS